MNTGERFRHCVTLLLLCGIMGCGGYEPPTGGERVDTFPITGTVTVDGKPAELLRVTCQPVGEGSVAISIADLTDKDGKFSASTYVSGDGAPEGEYRLIFFWGQYGMSGYGGPDKLNGRYTDPEKSEYKCTVKQGQPSDLGEIQLTTK